MYSVAVQDHFMIAHSFRGEVFGPAQGLHGATYDVELEFRRDELDPDGLVVDIGLATDVLRSILGELNYKNLDELPMFSGMNTTTEFLAREVFDRVSAAIDDGSLGRHAGGLASLRVRLTESPRAWAAYEGRVGSS